jgi:hypothetical protein
LSQLAPQQQELALIEPGRLSPPIWPCTTRGFPCLVCLQTSGGLLPHRFTLTAESAFAGVLQVSLRDATVLHSTGGLFSVALSVNSGTGFSLCAFPVIHFGWGYTSSSLRHYSPGVTRRVAHRFPTLRPETSVSGLSSRPHLLTRTSDHPAHPLFSLYRVSYSEFPFVL